MNVIGERVVVMGASDPTLVGRTGTVVLETANTLILDSLGKTLRIAKSRASFKLLGTGKVVSGLDIAGRLQDRLGRGSP